MLSVLPNDRDLYYLMAVQFYIKNKQYNQSQYIIPKRWEFKKEIHKVKYVNDQRWGG